MSYGYSHRYWIDNRIDVGKTHITAMLKAVQAKWNNELTL